MSKKEVSFEENLVELEKIVKQLENGDTNLDDAINEFNKAMKLAKLCDEKLKQAEETLTKIVSEDNTLENFEVDK